MALPMIFDDVSSASWAHRLRATPALRTLCLDGFIHAFPIWLVITFPMKLVDRSVSEGNTMDFPHPLVNVYPFTLPGLVNVNKKLWKDPPFFMRKFTISMAMFNSYVSLPEGTLFV